MEKQHKVTVSISKEESELLQQIAIKNNLTISDKNKQFSEGKALKFLLGEQLNNTNKKDKNDLQHITHLLEQMHVITPHLLFNSIFNLRYISSVVEDKKFNEIYHETLQDIVKKCGQMQLQQYHELYVSSDKKNMKTIPIEDDKNTWK